MSEALERVIAKSEIYDLSCKYMRGLDRLDIGIITDRNSMTNRNRVSI